MNHTSMKKSVMGQIRLDGVDVEIIALFFPYKQLTGATSLSLEVYIIQALRN